MRTRLGKCKHLNGNNDHSPELRAVQSPAYFMESQNHEMACVGKDLKDNLVPTPSISRDTAH